MKFEYCQKCDSAIKPQKKAYEKNGQILCKECYLRATRQKHAKSATSKYETTSGFFKKIFKVIPPSWKTGWGTGFKKAGKFVGGVIIGLGLLMGIAIALAIFTTWVEDVSTSGGKRVVTNSRREETKRAEAELQRAKAEYAKAKAELEAVRAWAEAELTKSNAKLQAIVNSVVTVDGELRIPEKQAQKYIDDAMEVCAQRGREIDAVVEDAKRKAHRAGNKLIEAKRKARDAGVELEKIAF